jgi:hypothetical protein
VSDSVIVFLRSYIDEAELLKLTTNGVDQQDEIISTLEADQAAKARACRVSMAGVPKDEKAKKADDARASRAAARRVATFGVPKMKPDPGRERRWYPRECNERVGETCLVVSQSLVFNAESRQD